MPSLPRKTEGTSCHHSFLLILCFGDLCHLPNNDSSLGQQMNDDRITHSHFGLESENFFAIPCRVGCLVPQWYSNDGMDRSWHYGQTPSHQPSQPGRQPSGAGSPVAVERIVRPWLEAKVLSSELFLFSLFSEVREKYRD